MNSLNDYSIVQLLPFSLKQDKFVVALAEAFEKEIKEAYREAEALSDLSNEDNLPEKLLDFLAYEKHVDFYDTDLTKEVKQQLIKNSNNLHKTKGTPAAVEQAAKIVFGRSSIQEWYEYNGSPYMFKANVEATNRGASQEDLTLLEQLINAYKNKRSWLEIINIFLSANGVVYFGGSITSGEEITVYPWSPTETISTGKINLKSSNRFVETTIIYPKEAE